MPQNAAGLTGMLRRMLPPGPRTLSLVQAYRFIFHPAAHVRAMQAKYGDVVRFHSAVGKGVAVMAPALVREVFAASPERFEALPMVDPLFGPARVRCCATWCTPFTPRSWRAASSTSPGSRPGGAYSKRARRSTLGRTTSCAVAAPGAREPWAETCSASFSPLATTTAPPRPNRRFETSSSRCCSRATKPARPPLPGASTTFHGSPRLSARCAELDSLGADPAPEALVRLPYLSAVVSEALRIQPIVTDVLRVCREPFTLGGKWTVPRGEVIAVMILAIMKDARLFPEPDRFRPERFLEKKYGIAEFLPFGGGARRCLGAAFAEAELALAVAEVVRRWELEPASAEPEHATRKNVTMGPARGVRLRVAGSRAPA